MLRILASFVYSAIIVGEFYFQFFAVVFKKIGILFDVKSEIGVPLYFPFQIKKLPISTTVQSCLLEKILKGSI